MMAEEQEPEEVTGEVVQAGDSLGEAKYQAAQAMLDKLEHDRFPSLNQMDLIEAMLPRELYPRFLSILTEKVRNDPFPSAALLERIARLSKI